MKKLVMCLCMYVFFFTVLINIKRLSWTVRPSKQQGGEMVMLIKTHFLGFVRDLARKIRCDGWVFFFVIISYKLTFNHPTIQSYQSWKHRTESGCPTNEYSQEAVGMAPLHWAATEGRLRASAWLLGPGGAEPEGRDNQVMIHYYVAIRRYCYCYNLFLLLLVTWDSGDFLYVPLSVLAWPLFFWLIINFYIYTIINRGSLRSFYRNIYIYMWYFSFWWFCIQIVVIK